MAGRPRKYDWDAWLDGGRHPLMRGHDFDVDARSFQLQVLNEVRRRRANGQPDLKVITKTTTDANGVPWVLIDGREQPKPKRKPRNWDEVFARPKTVLERGKDFSCTADSMRGAAYQAAARRRIDIQTSADDQFVVITVGVTSREADHG